LLDAKERRQVIGKRAADRVRADATPVDPSSCRDDLLRAWIDAVLIGKDVDPESLDEPPISTLPTREIPRP
jgi:hypothetical protein